MAEDITDADVMAARARNEAEHPFLVGNCAVCGNRLVVVHNPMRWVDPQTGNHCTHRT